MAGKVLEAANSELSCIRVPAPGLPHLPGADLRGVRGQERCGRTPGHEAGAELMVRPPSHSSCVQDSVYPHVQQRDPGALTPRMLHSPSQGTLSSLWSRPRRMWAPPRSPQGAETPLLQVGRDSPQVGKDRSPKVSPPPSGHRCKHGGLQAPGRGSAGHAPDTPALPPRCFSAAV